MTETPTEGLIEVVQLPVIVEKLLSVSKQVKEAVEYVLSLECNEETYKQIKKQKAELNKQYAELDARRKAVKAAILAPYNQFEAVYNELIRDVFKPAEKEISLKIEEVENGLKSAKRDEVFEYFTEYSKAKGIDFLTLDDIHLNITLSASLKSLKKQVKDFVDKTINDLALIATQDYATEILVEYRRTLDATYSIMEVKDRHRAIAEEEQRIEEVKASEQQNQEVIAKVDEAIESLSAPTVEETEQKENEPVYTTSFTVRGTMAQLKALKKFLKEGAYDYE